MPTRKPTESARPARLGADAADRDRVEEQERPDQPAAQGGDQGREGVAAAAEAAQYLGAPSRGVGLCRTLVSGRAAA